MADVVICYARDGEGTAERLSRLLRADGFSIWSEAAARGPVTDRIGDVRAAVVIWSEAARASEWIKAEANYARGQRKLIQASVDGEPPPMPFDGDAVAPLAGFTGEEDHPGWLRVRRELEELCRKRTPPAVVAAAAPVASAPPPPRPVAARKSGRGLASALAVLLALAVVGGAFLWMRSGPPFGSEPTPPTTVPKARTPAAAPAPPPQATSPPVMAAPAPLPPRQEVPAEDDPLTKTEDRPRPAAEERPAPRVQERPARARPAPLPSGARINRRNSRNMRLFCERAGRGTPQCRTFQRQLRNQGR